MIGGRTYMIIYELIETLIWQEIRYIHESYRNYKESGHMHNLDFANLLTLIACFIISYKKHNITQC